MSARCFIFLISCSGKSVRPDFPVPKPSRQVPIQLNSKLIIFLFPIKWNKKFNTTIFIHRFIGPTIYCPNGFFSDKVFLLIYHHHYMLLQIMAPVYRRIPATEPFLYYFFRVCPVHGKSAAKNFLCVQNPDMMPQVFSWNQVQLIVQSVLNCRMPFYFWKKAQTIWVIRCHVRAKKVKSQS